MPTRSFKNILALLDRLHGKNGCPWDRKQTLKSTKKHLLEETCEVLEAIDENDAEKLKEELGDLLFQVLTCAKIAQKNKKFRVRDILDSVHEKMVRRHPHVFGGIKAQSVRDVLANWNRIKHLEKPHRAGLPFGRDIPRTFPALKRAESLYGSALSKGAPVMNKKELSNNIGRSLRDIRSSGKNVLSKKIGPLLFDIAAFASMNKISPEDSLVKANRVFEKKANRLISKKRGSL